MCTRIQTVLCLIVLLIINSSIKRISCDNINQQELDLKTGDIILPGVYTFPPIIENSLWKDFISPAPVGIGDGTNDNPISIDLYSNCAGLIYNIKQNPFSTTNNPAIIIQLIRENSVVQELLLENPSAIVKFALINDNSGGIGLAVLNNIATPIAISPPVGSPGSHLAPHIFQINFYHLQDFVSNTNTNKQYLIQSTPIQLNEESIAGNYVFSPTVHILDMNTDANGYLSVISQRRGATNSAGEYLNFYWWQIFQNEYQPTQEIPIDPKLLSCTDSKKLKFRSDYHKTSPPNNGIISTYIECSGESIFLLSNEDPTKPIRYAITNSAVAGGNFILQTLDNNDINSLQSSNKVYSIISTSSVNCIQINSQLDGNLIGVHCISNTIGKMLGLAKYEQSLIIIVTQTSDHIIRLTAYNSNGFNLFPRTEELNWENYVWRLNFPSQGANFNDLIAIDSKLYLLAQINKESYSSILFRLEPDTGEPIAYTHTQFYNPGLTTIQTCKFISPHSILLKCFSNSDSSTQKLISINTDVNSIHDSGRWRQPNNPNSQFMIVNANRDNHAGESNPINNVVHVKSDASDNINPAPSIDSLPGLNGYMHYPAETSHSTAIFAILVGSVCLVLILAAVLLAANYYHTARIAKQKEINQRIQYDTQYNPANMITSSNADLAGISTQH